jgi:hypothetical protein
MASGRATKKAAWLGGVFAMLVLGLTFAGAPLAQTTTAVDVRKFEVIAVDGNRLVVRDERGTNEYTVPDDFRFTVDGKKMSASQLKAGMKGTATVTTTTTVKPVVVTEIRHGVVLKVWAGTVTVLDNTDGLRKRFTQDQLNERGLQIFKDGRVITISQLNKGDEISATIVSQRPPEVVTEQEVEATLAPSESKTESPATAMAAAPAVAAQPTTADATPQPAAAPPAPAPVESSGLGTAWYVLIAVVIAAVLFLVLRRRKDSNQPR